MASVVVVFVVDDFLHSVSCMLKGFSRTTGHNASIDHPAGYLRKPVADVSEKRKKNTR